MGYQAWGTKHAIMLSNGGWGGSTPLDRGSLRRFPLGIEPRRRALATARADWAGRLGAGAVSWPLSHDSCARRQIRGSRTGTSYCGTCRQS